MCRRINTTIVKKCKGKMQIMQMYAMYMYDMYITNSNYMYVVQRFPSA